MRILFEQHQYDAHLLDKILQDIITGVELDFTKKAKVNFVGYFFCAPINDCVFILPKVLLKDEEREVDGKKVTVDVIAGVEYTDEEGNTRSITPEDIITTEGQQKFLNKEYRKFLYEFSVWVYRCLNMYRILNPNENSIYFKQLPQAGGSHKHKARTFLDIILSLIRFNNDNQNFFMFTIKNQHSGMNKINWTKTISKSQAIIQDNTPIYLKPVNKKRKINFDEELFVIFFSILNYLNEQYGFKVPLNCNYELITGKKFDSYFKSIGAKRLKQIKYKYFSDKALELWNLCYAFFDNTHLLNISTDNKEYLLAKNFEHVFEAMIDELIGESRENIPRGLKDQEDGKRVDHMYTYKSLINHNEDEEEIYYIGDSKYYKSGHKLGTTSVAKQYTYARNVVQWNIDLWMNKTPDYWSEEDVDDRNTDLQNNRFNNIHLRKDDKGNITEGYNIIPNFFLSAFVDDERRYNANSDNIKLHINDKGEHSTYLSCQFENRLFDRDTLILSHYDVNFLYVMYLYARNKTSEKASWKEEVRKKFRDEIQNVLEEKFDFYVITAKEGVSQANYIGEHFQQLLGKLLTPYKDRENQQYFSLALDKRSEFDDENAAILSQLKDSFYVEQCTMSTDPRSLLPEVAPFVASMAIQNNFLTTHYLEKYADKSIIIGCYKDQPHLDWILGKNDKKTLIYNIRLGNQNVGGQKKTYLDKLAVSFVILYEFGREHENKYRIFHVHHHAVMTKERLKASLYPSEPRSDKYFCYVFDEEVSLGKFDINSIISSKRIELKNEFSEGMPLFFTGKELLGYRK